MTKRFVYALMLAECLFLPGLASAVQAAHPAATIASFYARPGEEPGGFNPYIVSIYALNEVQRGSHLGEVRDFILWYLAHLNQRDRYGLTGTMDDYVVTNGVERPSGTYDSADGYAGLFLHLLHQYVRRTGDIALVKSHGNRIDSIARLLLTLQNGRGLTKALPDEDMVYLMDNCEAFAGMAAYEYLRTRIGKRVSGRYVKAREALRSGILARLYDPKTVMFHWAADNGAPVPSSWDRFYPDAFAQLFPVYFGVLSDQRLVAQQLWISFTKRHAAAIETYPMEQRIMIELTRSVMEAPRP
jgi:hypothetical protein